MSDKNEAARAILKEARSVQDRFQQYKLLKSALEAVTDDTLKSEIEIEFRGLYQSIRSSLVIQILQLKTKEDYERFISALRSLEEWAKTGYPFTTSEEAQIKSARQWFDDKRTKEGAGVSKALIGGLRDKYILYQDVFNTKKEDIQTYYVNVDTKLTYEEYLANFAKVWREESKISCGKILISARQSAGASPSAARAFLQGVLNTEVEINYNNQILKIKEYPFDDPETEQINNYINKLEAPCKNESQAETLRTRANNATNSYTKYELLINARGYGWSVPLLDGSADDQTFHLPGLDQDIKEIHDIAAEVRSKIVKEKIDSISESVNTIPNLGKETIEEQFNRIEEKLHGILNDTIEWPGAGKIIQIGSDEKDIYIIKRPAELVKAEESYQKIRGEFKELQSVYENILKDAEKSIRKLLDDPDLNKKQEGVKVFNSLGNNEKKSIILKFQIYSDLQLYKAEYATFEDGEKAIQDNYNNENWLQVLQLYKTEINKPNFGKKCPLAIKQNILNLKKEATRKLKFQKIQDFVKKGNYLVAKQIWEQPLEDSEVDYWQPVIGHIEKIKQVEETGKEVLEFYKTLLLEFNMPYIFREILQDPEEIFNRLDSLSPSDAKVVKEILEKNKGQFFSQQYDADIVRYLSILLSKLSFEQKVTLLEKINHVAGKSKDSDSRWPAYALSLAEYEARLLSEYLSSLIRQETLEYLASVKNSASGLDLTNVGARINSIYKFDFSLSDKEKNILKDIEVAYAQARSKESTPEQALNIWEVVKKHFEQGEGVSGGYSGAKRNWYLSEVQKMRTKGQFDDALEVIAKGLDDEYVGTIVELYLEKAATMLVKGEFGEARRTIKEAFSKNEKKNELLKLEVEIDLAEKGVLHRDQPLALMASLFEYWNTVDGKYKSSVEKSLNTNYNLFSKRYVDDLNEKIKDDRAQAWRPMLDLMKLEDIYKQVNSRVRIVSSDFVEQLIPAFYPTGISLLEDSDVFNEKVTDHGVELKWCLSEGAEILNRITSYKELLDSLLGKELKDDDYSRLPLEEVIQLIITKKVKDQRKKEFINELKDYIEEYEGKQRKYADIQKNRSRVNKNLEQLKDIEKKLNGAMVGQKTEIIGATNPDLWVESALSVQSGKPNTTPWIKLDDFSEKLKDDKNFAEVGVFHSALGEWKSTCDSVYKEINSLDDEFSQEKFEDAQKSFQTLGNLYKRLPAFSRDAHKLPEVLSKLMGAVEATNSKTKDTIIGLSAIGNSITVLQKEIKAWGEEKDSTHNEVDGVNQKIKHIKEKVENFKNVDFRSHKEFLINKASGYLIEKYFEKIETIKLLSVQPKSFSSLPKPDIISNTSSRPPAQLNTNQEQGILASIKNLALGKKSQAENRLLKAILSSKEIAYSISAQKVDLDSVKTEIEATKKNDEISLATNSKTAEELKKDCDLLIKQKREWIKDLEEVSRKNSDCQKEISYPTKKELQAFYTGKQYNNMARRIVEADLIGSVIQNDRDEVNAFRAILEKVRWA